MRSAESWLASMEKTIFRALREDPDGAAIGTALIAQKTFGGRIDDPEHVVAVYEDHIAEVQETIPPERLLTYRLGDGWDPLCRFLGVPVPEAPFPRRNSAVEFNAPPED